MYFCDNVRHEYIFSTSIKSRSLSQSICLYFTVRAAAARISARLFSELFLSFQRTGQSGFFPSCYKSADPELKRAGPDKKSNMDIPEPEYEINFSY
jgi:hypothetical protein